MYRFSFRLFLIALFAAPVPVYATDMLGGLGEPAAATAPKPASSPTAKAIPDAITAQILVFGQKLHDSWRLTENLNKLAVDKTEQRKNTSPGSAEYTQLTRELNDISAQRKAQNDQREGWRREMIGITQNAPQLVQAAGITKDNDVREIAQMVTTRVKTTLDQQDR